MYKWEDYGWTDGQVGRWTGRMNGSIAGWADTWING